MSFQHQGRASYGIAKDDGVVDLGKRLGSRCPTLRALLAQGALGEASKLAREAPDHKLAEVSFLPVIPDPSKILAIGLNYTDHAKEVGAQLPAKPIVFPRWPDSQVGHEQPMVKPQESEQYDYEVELCVVIGKRARRVSPKDALGCVAGYTIYNDGSIRDWQFHTSQWAPGKNFPASGSVGPWMVTSDELPDAGRLRVTAKLNGKTLQDGNTANLIFPVPEIVSYISQFTNLEPGDLIPTGTPAGVGFSRKPPVFMKPGDTVELEIEKIGVLRNRIVEG
jgi:2-keto-4-pentenoate hydratase/2-oxohepta-3-ene-1,7-dioic acid hydratase in catechol pathway